MSVALDRLPDRRGLPGRLLHGWTLLRESRVATIGFALVAFWALVAMLAPLIAPYAPNVPDYGALGSPKPSAAHWLGTDISGRDLLSRIVWGARAVLIVAPISVLTAYVCGGAMGLIAGYRGGWTDMLISRVSDVILAFPVIILYMIILANFGASAFNVIFAITFAGAPQIARIVRGLTLELKQADYVAAAKLRGETAWYIMLVEILPNARGPLIVDACLRLGYSTITIGVLGFLGLGLPPPDPDWGGMVKETYAFMSVYPHMALFPSIAISSLVVGFNLLADGIREIGQRD